MVMIKRIVYLLFDSTVLSSFNSTSIMFIYIIFVLLHGSNWDHGSCSWDLLILFRCPVFPFYALGYHIYDTETTKKKNQESVENARVFSCFYTNKPWIFYNFHYTVHTIRSIQYIRWDILYFILLRVGVVDMFGFFHVATCVCENVNESLQIYMKCSVF